MPTFLILKGTSVVETVRGANPTQLRTAVLSAAANAAKGPGKSSASFQGKGHALGAATGTSSTGRTVSVPTVDFGALFASPAAFAQGRGIASAIVRFIGLYVTTFFSLDPARAAEESPFAIQTVKGQRVG